MKKRWALGLVLTLMLMLPVSGGLAEAEIAKDALKTAYGFTDNTFAFFMQTSAFGDEEGAEVKQFTFVPMKYLENIGIYSVNLSLATGEVVDTTWSLENIADTLAPIWTPRMAETLLMYGANENYRMQAGIEQTDYPLDDVSGFYRLTTFDSTLPKEVRTLLAQKGYDVYNPIRGAMWQFFESENASDSYVTEGLVTLEKHGRHILVGITKGQDGTAYVCDMGPQAILSGGEYTISHEGDKNKGPLPYGFRVTIPRLDGGDDTYSFMPSWRPDAWRIESVTRRDADGNGVFIGGGKPSDRFFGFNVYELSPDVEDRFVAYYPYYGSFLVDSLERPLAYPVSSEDASAQSQASLIYFAEQNVSLNLGVNLREKPTGHSKSLGLLKPGLPLNVLGQTPGTQFPWYHVRIGSLQGYVSGMYLEIPPRNRDGSLQMNDEKWLSALSGTIGYNPVPVARSLDDIRLRETADEVSEAAFEYPKNTLLHIICEAENGWLYVMAPREEISWDVDREGHGGYVRREEIAIYPTALQARLDMQ